MNSRAVAALVVLSLALAGCSGVGPNRKPIHASAERATVSPSALSATNYEELNRTTRVVNTTIRVSIQGDVELETTRRVISTTRITTYGATGDGAAEPPSLVVVHTAPLVKPVKTIDRRANPLRDWSTRTLVSNVQSRYTSVSELRPVENRTVTVLGNETTLTTYAGRATVDGRELEVSVRVARVRSEGDVVTVVAIHPRSGSAVPIRRLLESIRHR